MNSTALSNATQLQIVKKSLNVKEPEEHDSENQLKTKTWDKIMTWDITLNLIKQIEKNKLVRNRNIITQQPTHRYSMCRPSRQQDLPLSL